MNHPTETQSTRAPHPIAIGIALVTLAALLALAVLFATIGAPL